MKKFLQNMALILCSFTFMLVAAEGILRFLPVSSGVGFTQVDAQQTVFKALPNRNITYSKGWDFKLVIHKHVNNAGFLNAQDYVSTDPRPLVAVVGDSYIEALQLADHEPYFAQLQTTQDKVRVYSFGFSGAPLSQYLIWAQHAKQNYDNKYLVINVCGNDFDESLKRYKFAPGFYHYTNDIQPGLHLERCDLQTSRLHNLARQSKLIGYLVRNVVIADAMQKIQKILKPHKINYGNVTTNESNEAYLHNSYQAIDAFFADLPQYSGLAAKDIAFVLDDRSTTYDDKLSIQEIENSYFYKMKAYFAAKAQSLGYTVFDMAEPFKQHYKQHAQHFEFAFDYHWNALGHKVVAETIQQSTWWQKLQQLSS